MKKSSVFIIESLLSGILCLGLIVGLAEPSKYVSLTAENKNQLVISTTNPIVDSQIKTPSGSNLWFKADASSGVTFNQSTGKIEIAQNGYIQGLTAIHGIQSVKVDLVSGSLELYHAYSEPSDLNTPEYGADTIFTNTKTFEYTSNLPSHVRLRANSSSVVNSITICYDCMTAIDDPYRETLDDGLENSFIDSGSIGAYATTSYVVGEGNVCSNNSKRALRLDFKGVNAKRVSLNTQQNVSKHIADALPDLTNCVLTFKGKFSSNVDDKRIDVCPIGNWSENLTLGTSMEPYGEDGWYLYTLDLSDIVYPYSDAIIRIDFKPKGITNANADTAYLLLDEIEYHQKALHRKAQLESIDDGLENLSRDTNWENTYTSFDNDTVYGNHSRNSLMARPGKGSKDSKAKWYIALAPQFDDSYNEMHGGDLSSGYLKFDYLPINVLNPSKLYFRVLLSWDDEVVVEVNATQTADGWYHVLYDLSQLGYEPETHFIRFLIGYDVESSYLTSAKVYYDNIKRITVRQENYTQGWENMKRDTGWEKVNVSVDNFNTSSAASINSMKLTFKDKASDLNKNFICLSTQAEGLDSQYFCNSGIVEAKFLFGPGFTNKSIRLVITDSAWKAVRFDVPTVACGNGWYLLREDLSTIYDRYTPYNMDSGFNPSAGIIRLGFGFPFLTSSNKDDKTVWIDDVFIKKDMCTPVSGSVANLWQAYSTENVMLTESPYSNRGISTSNPLSFSDGRNGIDATQLMIQAKTAISNFNFRTESLYDETGHKLDPDTFEVLVAKYINVPSDSAEHNKQGWRGVGYYPDALVPIEKIIEYSENTIQSGNEQSIYINCRIPKGQPAGIYEGRALLTLNGVDYSIPMKVTVYDFSISDVKHNRSSFLIWDDQTQIGEKEHYSSKMRDKYYNFVNSKGINADKNGNWNGDYIDFAEAFAEKVAYNDNISTYRIPSDDTYEDIYGYLNALADKNIEMWDKGEHSSYFDKAIFYIIDEPNQPEKDPSSEAGQKSVQQWARCKQVQTNLRAAQAAIAPKLASYPEILESLMDVRNVVPFNCDYETITGGSYKEWLKTKYYPNYFNDEYLDTPCPTFDHLNDATQRNSYLSTFNHVWFYGCILPNMPFPSFHIDTPLMSARMIPWMQYDYNIEGQVYFCTNLYQKDGTTSSWVDRDVWTEALSTGKGAADGMLMYPGYRYNIYGPITSIRFENIRNSYEDYEYFYMFDQNIAKYQQRTGSAITSCRQLLSSYFTSMFTGTTPNQSFTSEQFASLRQYLMQQLTISY